MSAAAADDWEATCLIYDDAHRYPTTTMLDNEGSLIRGSIELAHCLNDTVLARKVHPFDHQQPRYRFWTLHESENYTTKSATTINGQQGEEEGPTLRFRVIFWGSAIQAESNGNFTATTEEEYDKLYQRVEITLLSEYPHSFPSELKEKWMEWLHAQAERILRDDGISYSVCTFVEHEALNYFPTLYKNEDKNRHVIWFPDVGPAFYDVPTLANAATVKRLLPLERQFSNGTRQLWHDTSRMLPLERTLILPILQEWKEWLPVQCPICLETVQPASSTLLECQHGFCTDCLTTYLRMKATDLHSEFTHNPFVCPEPKCKHGMRIFKVVKPHLTTALLDKVRNWYKDLKHPPCYALPDGCLKPSCKGKVLRKDTVDSYFISCEVCESRWCELCLQRAPKGKPHEDTSACKHEVCLQFCERYLAASEEGRAKAEAKWPWIKHYAKSRVHDHTIVQWIQSNGQICPGCKTGVERLEGCFHMSCQCGTHFCYECGTEIFPPYYGTHHCWERDNNNANNGAALFVTPQRRQQQQETNNYNPDNPYDVLFQAQQLYGW